MEEAENLNCNLGGGEGGGDGGSCGEEEEEVDVLLALVEKEVVTTLPE